MMNIPESVIYYFIIYRVLIVSAGVISIILGYKLFCKGIWPTTKNGKGASLDAKIGGTGLTLKNAAPGTFFALFGVLIISIMVIYGSPEYTLEKLDKAKKNIEETEAHEEFQQSIKKVLKNLKSEKSKQLINDILQQYKNEYIKTTQEAYDEIVKIIENSKDKND